MQHRALLQWQVLQLQELEQYRQKNLKKFSKDFKDIDKRVSDLYRDTFKNAQSAEEHELLGKIKSKQFTPDIDKGGFFRLNEPKLEALIMATQSDFVRAEYAMLRQANDQYRKIIFDAMTYANVTNDYKKATDIAVKDMVKGGIANEELNRVGLTYEQAIDMSTKDLLRAGIRPVVYKNGSRHSMSEYASMALRTGNKRAYLMGEGNAHDRYGLHYVSVNKRQDACPKCVGFLGKVLCDDVYGGGTRAEANKMGVPTLSDAMQAGFLHPNCKDMYSVYIPGVSKEAKPWNKQEIQEIVGEYNQEQQLQHSIDMQETYQRMAKYSLDPDNQQIYQTRADNWQARADEIRHTPAVPVAPPVPTPATPNVASQATSEKDSLRYNIDRLKGEIADKSNEVASLEQFDKDHLVYISHQDFADVFGEDINTTLDNAIDRAKDVYAQVPTDFNKRSIERLERIKKDLAKHQDEKYVNDVKDKINNANKEIDKLRKQMFADEEKLYQLSISSDSLTEVNMLKETVNGSQPMKDLVSYGTTNKVQYRTVNVLPSKLTEEEIIEKIAGGDMTSGSCVSLSCAYAGNMNGYDVIDFRGGDSCKMFALNRNNKKLCDLPGVVAHKVTDFSAVKGANQLISDMAEGKLYILVTGQHASVVRKTNGIAQYLELQSATNSGWHNFEKNTLKDRFGCKRSRTVYGTKLEQLSYTIEVDSLYNNKEFNNLLGYINTAVGDQKKGALGSVK